MTKQICKYIMLLVLFLSANNIFAENKAILLDVQGAIGPATQDFIQRSLDEAVKNKAVFIILQLDTPGGLETSMRGIDKAILSSPIPFITYVAPQGARAASAGTFILYASHIAAMAPGTNLGAASPVSIGEIPSPTKETKKDTSTLEKKAMNDSAAYIRSLAKLRNRNAAWGEKAIREAVSLSADEALKLNVIDVVATDVSDLLTKINGKKVLIINATKTLQTQNAKVETVKPDWRFQFLALITDPNIAYILLLIGIYGLFFEFYNPGLVLPGVAGTIALLIALYALQLLPVNYAGFSLLLIGIMFLVAEIFVSSYGVLGIGGLIAFVLGSIFLLDTNVPGYSIAWQLIAIMTLISAVFFFIVFTLAVRSQKRKVVSGKEALIGATGVVINNNLAHVNGEMWQIESDESLPNGSAIQVIEIKGLVLKVKPIRKN